MPTVYEVYGFKIYFWTEEGDEPIHFHVSVGDVKFESTKFWVLSDGSMELAHNNSGYNEFELRHLIHLINEMKLQHYIIKLWNERFKCMRFIR